MERELEVAASRAGRALLGTGVHDLATGTAGVAADGFGARGPAAGDEQGSADREDGAESRESVVAGRRDPRHAGHGPELTARLIVAPVVAADVVPLMPRLKNPVDVVPVQPAADA